MTDPNDRIRAAISAWVAELSDRALYDLGQRIAAAVAANADAAAEIIRNKGENGSVMGVDGRGPRKRSRVVTGFHRLGLFLAVPLLLGALGTAISAWFSDDGPYVPDLSQTTLLPVVLRSQSSDVRTMSDDELRIARARAILQARRRLETKVTVEIDTGPIRTFAFYLADPTKPEDVTTDETQRFAVVRSLTSYEASRGAVLSSNEQPVLIGAFMLQEEGERRYPFLRWKHLKHGLDWQRLGIAAAIAALALVLYAFFRALGWVIDGFVSRPGD